MNMQQKMAEHVGQLIQVQAPNFTSEVGELQRVYINNFIKMKDVNYVTKASNQILLMEAKVPSGLRKALVRTKFELGAFEAYYMSKGSDFVEIARPMLGLGRSGKALTALMVPMKNVIGLQFLD